MGKHSKRKKNRKQTESLHIAAQQLAQLYKRLDVKSLQAWSADYLEGHDENQLRKLIAYVIQHYPEEHKLFYDQIVLAEQLKQQNVKPTALVTADSRKR